MRCANRATTSTSSSTAGSSMTAPSAMRSPRPSATPSPKGTIRSSSSSSRSIRSASTSTSTRPRTRSSSPTRGWSLTCCAARSSAPCAPTTSSPRSRTIIRRAGALAWARPASPAVPRAAAKAPVRTSRPRSTGRAARASFRPAASFPNTRRPLRAGAGSSPWRAVTPAVMHPAMPEEARVALPRLFPARPLPFPKILPLACRPQGRTDIRAIPAATPRLRGHSRVKVMAEPRAAPWKVRPVRRA